MTERYSSALLAPSRDLTSALGRFGHLVKEKSQPECASNAEPRAAALPGHHKQESHARRKARRAEDKWSPQVLRHGYTALPNLLLRAQGALNITPPQFNVLAQLASHWWDAERAPFPAKQTLAERMRVSPRQIQRIITQLERAGLIRRIARFSAHHGQLNNAYSFDGLLARLKEMAELTT